jgi:uncharacterized protein YciI
MTIVINRPSGSEQGDVTGMHYYALFYEVVDDFVSRRAMYRGEHLRLVEEAHRRGELRLAGALGDPATRALLVFRTPDRSAVERFARNDPYVMRGLVTRWDIQPWANVIEDEPSTPQPTGGSR